jgi:ribonucleoside-diphosphate reductase alpha chain
VQENEQLHGKIGQPMRRHLPDTRQAITHKFNVGGHEGYMTVGLFDNGDPGELFITMAKEGSTIGGLMDTIGTLTSISLQYGVKIETLARKFTHQRFEPSGYTGNPEIKMASSIIDYVFRWLELHFVTSREAQKTEEVPEPTLE